LIRPATKDDIPFILDLIESSYGYQGKPVERIESLIASGDVIFLVGGHSFGVGCISRYFYWDKPRGHILWVASRPQGLSREALRLMQKIVDWLKIKGCFEVTFGSEIGTDYAPFAKLLGASPSPSYVIRFDKEPEYA
jgi:hypothetical protein